LPSTKVRPLVAPGGIGGDGGVNLLFYPATLLRLLAWRRLAAVGLTVEGDGGAARHRKPFGSDLETRQLNAAASASARGPDLPHRPPLPGETVRMLVLRFANSIFG
jgi:hypothetical protein